MGTTLREAEKRLIRETLKKTGGHRSQAAQLLGISVRALHYKIKEYGIRDRDS